MYTILKVLITSVLFPFFAYSLSSNTGFLAGNIYLYDENCIPGPSSPPCKKIPVQATLLITQPSEDHKSENEIDRISSNENGSFYIELPEGKYSLFVHHENEIICSWKECSPGCICTPVQIIAGDTTTTEFILNKANW